MTNDRDNETKRDRDLATGLISGMCLIVKDQNELGGMQKF